MSRFALRWGWTAAALNKVREPVQWQSICKKARKLAWKRKLAANLTGEGEGEGDDEQIIVNLAQVPANVKSLIFTVNSFTGQNFSRVENAFCRLVNQANGKELARYNLSVQGSHTAQIMAKVYRHNGEWKMHAIGENSSGRTFQDLLPQILPHL